MKKFLGAVMNVLLILVGASIIIFVLRMIWLPPGPMGMMMGTDMMYYHMGSWMRGTFLIFILFVIIMIMMLLLKDRNDNGR